MFGLLERSGLRVSYMEEEEVAGVWLTLRAGRSADDILQFYGSEVSPSTVKDLDKIFFNDKLIPIT